MLNTFKGALRSLVVGHQADGAHFVMGCFREGLDTKQIAELIGPLSSTSIGRSPPRAKTRGWPDADPIATIVWPGATLMRILLIDSDDVTAQSVELMLKSNDLTSTERTTARTASTSPSSTTTTPSCSR